MHPWRNRIAPYVVFMSSAICVLYLSCHLTCRVFEQSAASVQQDVEIADAQLKAEMRMLILAEETAHKVRLISSRILFYLFSRVMP